jgi:hypothetical protein
LQSNFWVFLQSIAIEILYSCILEIAVHLLCLATMVFDLSQLGSFIPNTSKITPHAIPTEFAHLLQYDHDDFNKNLWLFICRINGPRVRRTCP